MFSWLESWQRAVLSLLLAFIVSYLMVPQVKKFAESIGAIDKPNPRRINKEPVPRMGGIAIFCGFMLPALLFAELTAFRVEIDGVHAEIRRGDLERAARARARLLEYQRDVLSAMYIVRNARFFLFLEFRRQIEQIKYLLRRKIEQLQKASSLKIHGFLLSG